MSQSRNSLRVNLPRGVGGAARPISHRYSVSSYQSRKLTVDQQVLQQAFSVESSQKDIAVAIRAMKELAAEKNNFPELIGPLYWLTMQYDKKAAGHVAKELRQLRFETIVRLIEIAVNPDYADLVPYCCEALFNIFREFNLEEFFAFNSFELEYQSTGLVKAYLLIILSLNLTIESLKQRCENLDALPEVLPPELASTCWKIAKQISSKIANKNKNEVHAQKITAIKNNIFNFDTAEMGKNNYINQLFLAAVFPEFSYEEKFQFIANIDAAHPQAMHLYGIYVDSLIAEHKDQDIVLFLSMLLPDFLKGEIVQDAAAPLLVKLWPSIEVGNQASLFDLYYSRISGEIASSAQVKNNAYLVLALLYEQLPKIQQEKLLRFLIVGLDSCFDSAPAQACEKLSPLIIIANQASENTREQLAPLVLNLFNDPDRGSDSEGGFEDGSEDELSEEFDGSEYSDEEQDQEQKAAAQQQIGQPQTEGNQANQLQLFLLEFIRPLFSHWSDEMRRSFHALLVSTYSETNEPQAEMILAELLAPEFAKLDKNLQEEIGIKLKYFSHPFSRLALGLINEIVVINHHNASAQAISASGVGLHAANNQNLPSGEASSNRIKKAFDQVMASITTRY